MKEHTSTERYIILDALRGLALAGICLANNPEFSLYTFQPKDVVSAMPTAGIDIILKYLQYIFIDGKFYTIFSVLFGIGFSIMLSGASRKNQNRLNIFYRRMIVLFAIGLFHLLIFWAGDILILYAFLGLLLPFFRNVPDKKLLIYACILLLFPVVVDAVVQLSGLNMAAPVIKATKYFHGKFGITSENFPVWLAESNSYADVLKFNLAGAFIRMQEFIEGNRAFKVLGLFLLGLYIGRRKMYVNMKDNKNILKNVRNYGFCIGLPASLLYAWSAMNSHPLGLATHSFIYAVSVVPLGLAYMAAFCLWFLKRSESKNFTMLAKPGRMALTNYIIQSVIGIIIFYGVGFALGAKTGLVFVELIAVTVFAFQIIASYFWLKFFRYGPLEWIWRMLTYKQRLDLRKTGNF